MFFPYLVTNLAHLFTFSYSRKIFFKTGFKKRRKNCVRKLFFTDELQCHNKDEIKTYKIHIISFMIYEQTHVFISIQATKN